MSPNESGQWLLSKVIEWRDNVPYVVGKEVFTKTSLTAMVPAAIATQFKPRRNRDGEIKEEDKDFIGLTCGEAMMIRQARDASYGALDATEFLTDRLCGKPKQSVESTSLTMTFQDYLDTLPPPPQINVVEIEALLELKPDDASQAHSLKLRKLQHLALTDDL